MGIMSGREVETPEEIKKILEPSENVLEGVQQAGFGGKITGIASIFVTNKRMIKLMPKTLGLRYEIEDYLYKDIANVKLDNGILRSSIHIVTRFRTEPIIIENIPKEAANKIFKIVQEGIGNFS
jgi:hypothetical protein